VTVDARENWWGDPSGPFQSTANPGGLGDAVTSSVDYADWLEADPSVDTTPPAEVTLTGAAADVWTPSVTVSWANPGDADLHHLRLSRSDGAATTVLTDAAVGTSWTDTTVLFGTSYTWTVQAVDVSGNVSAGVPTSSLVVANPAPASLTLRAGAGSIGASWSASSAPAADIVGYRVRYGIRPDALTTQVDVGRTTRATLTGLVSGRRYYVTVSTRGTSGRESQQSAVRSTTPS
jgi:hypothetical protein